MSEARNEISLRQKNESAAIRASLANLRRDIDALDNRMKSDIATLKHEYVLQRMGRDHLLLVGYRLQMDLDNRKTESKTDLKEMDIAIEACTLLV